MKAKILVNAALGITIEILYTASIILSALLICVAFYLVK